MSKYGHFTGPYFPVFALNTVNTGKYGPEKTRYFDTIHAVVTMPSNSHSLDYVPAEPDNTIKFKNTNQLTPELTFSISIIYLL